ncbi:MAG: hypothetical protein CML02_06850 [Pseudooceanicola sp.]|nr:hypothetical protein [Pseudooceanicola sp.]
MRARIGWLAILAMLAALPMQAHEVIPTIGDLTVAEGRVELVLRMTAEAFVAGVDLDHVAETDTSDAAARYDALRALPPEALQAEITEWSGPWLDRLDLTIDGAPVPLGLGSVAADEVGDMAYVRPTILTLEGIAPPRAGDLRLTWPEGAGELVLRQQGVDDPFTGLLTGGTQSPPIPVDGGAALGGWATFVSYITVGFDHILPKGLDHILFVLGLFFLSTRLRPLLWQISAFTLAHTVTLALGAMGWVRVPGAVVEPLIAASIVYVAVENVMTARLHRWRPVVIFCFGLLHGLGFASVLGDFGLPAGQFVPALLGFNIGVEVGQLTVIALAFLAVGAWFRDKPWYRARIAIPASCAIAAVGVWWVVERVFL